MLPSYVDVVLRYDAAYLETNAVLLTVAWEALPKYTTSLENLTGYKVVDSFNRDLFVSSRSSQLLTRWASARTCSAASTPTASKSPRPFSREPSSRWASCCWRSLLILGNFLLTQLKLFSPLQSFSVKGTEQLRRTIVHAAVGLNHN